VSPGTASTGPGDALEAQDLAATYAAQLATDQSLVRQLQDVTGLSASAVRAGIAAIHVGGTALVRVTFSAGTSTKALTGLRALTAFATRPPADSSLSTVAPQLVTADESATRVAVAPGGKRSPRAAQYAAHARLVVPSASANPGPGNAYEANTLAATLTGLIPSDQPTVDGLARDLHVPLAIVKNAVSATNEQNTSLIALTFAGGSPRVAQEGATALARSVSGANPTSPNIPSGSLSIVSLPALPSAGQPLKLAIPAGIILGLALGGILMVAFARAFPRIEDEETLSALAGCAATSVSFDAVGAIDALQRRWRTLSGHNDVIVALVAPTTSQAHLTRTLAGAINTEHPEDSLGTRPTAYASVGRTIKWDLVSAAAAEPMPNATAPDANGEGGPRTRPREELTARAAGALDADGNAQRIVLECDLAVLVVSAGTKDIDVERAARVLGDYGRSPGWAVLVPRRPRRKDEA